MSQTSKSKWAYKPSLPKVTLEEEIHQLDSTIKFFQNRFEQSLLLKIKQFEVIKKLEEDKLNILKNIERKLNDIERKVK